MMQYRLTRSPNKLKKFRVEYMLNNKYQNIDFGASGYSDFTINKNINKKKAYLARHRVDENWDDLNTAGAWARYLLWNKETILQSINDMEKKFKIKIIY
jgi:hypothetical protein